jgi:predicted phage terminase large subunit-like protein
MPILDRVDPDLLKKIPNLPEHEQREMLALIEELEAAEAKELARDGFMPFIKRVWPAFIEGRHHKIMGDAFERVARGELKRLIINMPPRHTKSEFASYLLPAWFLGNFPEKKIIQTAHTAELSVGFGRKVRNLVDSEDYKQVFPTLGLRADSKAAGRWSTTQGGEYFAIGVGGAVTGKGADLLIIDDPHSEQEGQSADPGVFDKVYEWYTSGPRQRLQPGGAIIVVMTRWHKRDLTGQIIKSSVQRAGTDEWEVIEFPAIMPSGKSLWPQFWPLEELESLRNELPAPKWNAQYQQNPTSEEGALVKREWWREWDSDVPPECEFIIQSWDTAFLKTQRSDFSACTTWGVFYHPDDVGTMQANIILLDAHKERLEFPELKKKAYEFYGYWEPDACIVEAKAAGTPLIFELRAMGIPVAEYTPSRGNDKISRVNAVSDLFASGNVWRPNTRFAEEVVEEFAAFPAGEHDDLVDSSTQALLRFRQGGFLRLLSDEEDEPFYPRKASYY